MQAGITTYFLAPTLQSKILSSKILNKCPLFRYGVWLSVAATPEGVQDTIHSFYQKGIARVDAWTPAQPAMNYPGEMVTMLVRYRRRQPGDRSSGR